MPSEASSSKSGSVTAQAKIDIATRYMKSSKSKIAHVAVLEKALPARVRKLLFSELVKDIGKRSKHNSLIVTIVPIPVPKEDDDYDEEEVDVFVS